MKINNENINHEVDWLTLAPVGKERWWEQEPSYYPPESSPTEEENGNQIESGEKL